MQASPAAQLDLFNYMSVATKDPQEEVRVVNTNHGPGRYA
jgi:hypothetical protein